MRSTPDWPLLVSGDANKDRSVDAWTRDFDRFFRTASLRALFHGAPHGGAARHQRIAALDQGQSQSQDQKRELYGRALVVIAAEQHACRLVVPSSQRFGAKRWPSHKDHAAKALQKLAGPHLPATLKQLEKAIAKAGAELHEAQEQARAESRKRMTADRKATDAAADVCAVDEADGPAETCDELDDDLVDGQVEDEDIVDVGDELEPDEPGL